MTVSRKAVVPGGYTVGCTQAAKPLVVVNSVAERTARASRDTGRMADVEKHEN